MDDILELSSDSEETIIYTPQKVLSPNHEVDVESIVNKYIFDNLEANQPNESDNIDKYRFPEDNLDAPLAKRSKTDHRALETLSDSSASSEYDENVMLLKLHEKYNKPTSMKIFHKEVQINKENSQPLKNKELKKLEKDIQKQKKLEEREQRKKEVKQAKIIKKVLSNANKNIKPTECLKFITVAIDNDIINDEYGSEILSVLKGMEVQYSVQSQIFPCTITWTRTIQSHSLDNSGKLMLSSETQEEDQVIIIMRCKEFLDHISNKSLCTYVTSLKSVLPNKRSTLVIYGLQSYQRHLKNQKQNEIRLDILNEIEKPSASKNFFKDFPQVSNKMIQYGLTEIQLLNSCSHRLIDSAADLGSLVAQFTKAVAEIPFKRQRHEKFQQTEWFAAGDNRDCVKVDKNGNGLNRLWNQMLTTFPLARLETAEAISSQYKTVSALMKAYENCQSTQESETLLQDIPVRRAAGPLSSTRKIGPELSKKVHNFFTATDGDTLL